MLNLCQCSINSFFFFFPTVHRKRVALQDIACFSNLSYASELILADQHLFQSERHFRPTFSHRIYLSTSEERSRKTQATKQCAEMSGEWPRGPLRCCCTSLRKGGKENRNRAREGVRVSTLSADSGER